MESEFDTESQVSLQYNEYGNHSEDEKKAFVWNQIEYSVNGTKILHGISGHIMKGQLVGILGHSGAGKTTLLNVLSGRVASKNSELTGSIWSNDEQIQDTFALKEMCGYVTQKDVLCPTSTTRECIEFSADLRCSQHANYKTKQQSIDSVISALKLRSCEHIKVGKSFEKGISGGEAKRVSIGMELVTNPQLLILDEPISGLDSHTALQTMKILKQLTTDYGKQILLTIHQPSSKIFDMFDKIVLMSRGHCVYFGSSSKLPQYFEMLGYRCPEYTNFADFVIQSIEKDPEFFISAWSKFKQKSMHGFTEQHDSETTILRMGTQDKYERNRINTGNGRCCSSIMNNLPRASLLKQIRLLFAREFQALHRYPRFLMQRMFTLCLTALTFVVLYHNVPNTMRGATDISNCLLFMVSAFFAHSMGTAMEITVGKRLLFEHERASKTYSTLAWLVSRIMLMVSIKIIDAAIFSSIATVGVFYADLSVDFAAQFMAVLVVGGCAADAVGVLLAFCANDLVQAISMQVMFVPLVLLNDLAVNMDRLHPVFSWLKNCNMLTYVFDALFGLVFSRRHIELSSTMTLSGEEYLQYLKLGARPFRQNIEMLMIIAGVIWIVNWMLRVKRNGI